MSTIARLLERVTATLERAEVLDRPADAGQQLTGRLKAGPVKDLLSGTPAGHPLHPVLVTVPIGALTGAVTLDVLGGNEAASRRLIGLSVLSAVPAAAAGLSDWSETQGAERRVGVVHALLNVAGLGLLTASWVARGRGSGGRLLSTAGLGVIGMSGWLGGHLSYALGVGVDTTAFQRPPTEWTDACAESELEDGSPHAVTVAQTPVMLLRQGGRLHVLGDRCTHRGGALHEGQVVDGCIQCPLHGSRFSLDDGAVERGPATRPAPVFEVRVVDGRVQVRRQEVRALRTNPVA
jgi:nitrite reductase/ring-hydroxylating ferredoxin subunit/uncharacterized membrane protein